MGEPRPSVPVHATLDRLPAAEARALLLRCCGSTRWTEAMLERRPFSSDHALFTAAESVWAELAVADHLEAFSSHPEIGARASDGFSAEEQAQVAEAPDTTRKDLIGLNRVYRDRFGFVFLICATGKSAGEILGLLRERIQNSAATELRIAAAEQAKITRLRLEKLTP